MKSLDPRVNRIDLDAETGITEKHEHWETYEVFHQKKRGAQSIHVGIVHASNPELALLFAKEQFARRQETSAIWVVCTSDVYTFRQEDDDMFDTTPEKTYREATGYSVRNKINKFKEENA